MNVIETLNRRYSTKRFDKTKKISELDMNIILESLILSQSAIGLQPWKFLVIKNPDIRVRLKEVSWGQEQVTDASEYIVFTMRENIDEEYINKYLEGMAKVRSVDVSSLDKFKAMINNYEPVKDKTKTAEYSKNQVYIALGNLLTVLPFMGIDGCTIGGIDSEKYDEILGLKGTGYKTVVACAIGYRDQSDKYAKIPKVRFDKDFLIETMI